MTSGSHGVLLETLFTLADPPRKLFRVFSGLNGWFLSHWPGDGWSSRAEDAILHGCIPVVIMDEVHAVYESILDWDMFSVRIKESEIDRVPQVSGFVAGSSIIAIWFQTS